jgi:hypothetical protein
VIVRVVEHAAAATLGHSVELIVDTWNVLYKGGILDRDGDGDDLGGLARLLRAGRWGQDRVTLVCDGTGASRNPGGPRLAIVHTGPRRSADEEIIARVAASHSARDTLVVTSDREIQRAVQRRGAAVMDSATFIRALLDDVARPAESETARPGGLSAARAAEWRAEFGVGKEDVTAIEADLAREDAPPPAEEESVHAEPLDEVPTELIPLPDELIAEARRLLGGAQDQG